MATAAENGVDATTSGADNSVVDATTSTANSAADAATTAAANTADAATASAQQAGDALNSAAGQAASAPAGAGDAATTASAQVHSGVMHFLEIGGPVVWILSLFALAALVILLVKMWQFARLRAESHRDIDQALQYWRDGNAATAVASLKSGRPASELAAMAMKGLSSQAADLTLLREELSRIANQKLEQLRAFLRPLELIASLSPLLGLLGTVLGMITAFQNMQQAGAQVDPSVLSGGIWQALLTTAVGLAVAIPVVFCHAWLERKVERVAVVMNDSVTRVFTSHPRAQLMTSETAEMLRDVA